MIPAQLYRALLRDWKHNQMTAQQATDEALDYLSVIFDAIKDYDEYLVPNDRK